MKKIYIINCTLTNILIQVFLDNITELQIHLMEEGTFTYEFILAVLSALICNKIICNKHVSSTEKSDSSRDLTMEDM